MTAAELLAASGRFAIRPGLSDAEFDAIDAEFAVTFADDHRAFLAAGLPAGRGASGHPVLSVMQTDIICYGADLDDYLHREFGLGAAGDKQCRPTVMFWSLLVQ